MRYNYFVDYKRAATVSSCWRLRLRRYVLCVCDLCAIAIFHTPTIITVSVWPIGPIISPNNCRMLACGEGSHLRSEDSMAGAAKYGSVSGLSFDTAPNKWRASICRS